MLLGQGTPALALALCACSRWDPEGCPLTKALRMPEEVTFSAPSLLGRTGGPGTCALDTEPLLGPAFACALVYGGGLVSSGRCGPLGCRMSGGDSQGMVVLSQARLVLDCHSDAAICATMGWRRVAWRGGRATFPGNCKVVGRLSSLCIPMAPLSCFGVAGQIRGPFRDSTRAKWPRFCEAERGRRIRG